MYDYYMDFIDIIDLYIRVSKAPYSPYISLNHRADCSALAPISAVLHAIRALLGQ